MAHPSIVATRTRRKIRSAVSRPIRTRRTTSFSHATHTWPSLEAAATHVLDRELRRVSDQHHRHHACLHGVADHDVCGLRYGARHARAEHQDPGVADLAHG